MKIKFIAILVLIHVQTFGQVKVDTKLFGQKILDGKVKYKDGLENEFMRTLDSLFCKNPKDKTFYFKTADKIRQMSDGVLGEYFSGIASKYYLDRNLEFVNNVSTLSQKDIDGWLKEAAFDIAASEQNSDKLPLIKKRLEKLVNNCNCDVSKKEIIKKYNSILYKNIERELKNP